MKREIKFRIWDNELKAWYKPVYEAWNGKLYDLLICTNGSIFPNRYELMQFTGLHDKNGKEIYEGDIVKTETGKNMVITWSKKFASFCIERDGWAFQHWFGESCDSEELEVIGNLYENPELLK